MEQITLSIELPVSALELYNDWLDSDKHTEFTGGEAIIRPVTGTHHTAWDGYISGTILELEEGKRILKTWRTLEFPEGAEDSILELLFEEQGGGTVLTINQTKLQPGDGEKYYNGWKEHYFKPMQEYYSNK